MTTIIVCAFCLGYLLIALENVTKVNKAAIALIMCVVCWCLYAIGGYEGISGLGLNQTIEKNLGEAGTTLFFLMGAMTIVEVVDQYGGFNFVRGVLYSKSKGALLWKIGFMTLLLSAVLDNLTTSIVMIMILRKLVSDHRDRIWYASIVIIAANAGGAFSPIGDVTTIMIWNGGMITASGVIREIFVPSLLAFVVPAIIVQHRLRGPLPQPASDKAEKEVSTVTTWQRNLIFFIGVGGLCSVPVYHNLTDLPAFMGILLVLGTLWFVTEILNWKKGEHDATAKRISRLLSRIDMTTILFFLGILMSVAVLSETGVLHAVGAWLEETVGNCYLVTGAIGILSSVVDNVPLVAGSMKMYTIPTAEMIVADPSLAQYAVDGVFWQLLSYCAGVGGSMLIIGSAAGVVVMGLENISFGWYMRNITPLAFAGYISGILAYYLQNLILM